MSFFKMGIYWKLNFWGLNLLCFPSHFHQKRNLLILTCWKTCSNFVLNNKIWVCFIYGCWHILFNRLDFSWVDYIDITFLNWPASHYQEGSLNMSHQPKLRYSMFPPLKNLIYQHFAKPSLWPTYHSVAAFLVKKFVLTPQNKTKKEAVVWGVSFFSSCPCWYCCF